MKTEFQNSIVKIEFFAPYNEHQIAWINTYKIYIKSSDV